MTATVVRVTQRVAERALGPLGLRLLRCWWRFRDNRTLATRATVGRIARETNTPLRTAERAVQRLARSGLVTRARVLRDPGRKIAMRHVYGRAGSGGDLWVPRTTAEWMVAAPHARHGGDRRSPLFQVAGRSSSLRILRDRSSRVPASPTHEKKREAASDASLPRAFGAMVEPAMVFDFTFDAEQQEAGFGPAPATQLDAAFRDYRAEQRHRLVNEHLPAVSFGDFRSPLAPRVDLADPPAARARQLATAYRAAVEHELKCKTWFFRRGAITRSRHFGTLTRASEALAKANISPAAWAVWSCHQWRAAQRVTKRQSRLKAPPVGWMWSARRIQQRAQEFHDDSGNTCIGGRPLSAAGRRTVQEFERRRAQAVVAVLAGADVVMASSCAFPAGYRRTSALMTRAFTRAARELEQRARDGEFVWETEL